MAGKKGPTDFSIKAFLGIKQDRKVFVSGFVYGELSLNSFGIVDSTGHLEVTYDKTYKKSRNLANYGKSVRIYGGVLREKKMVLTSRACMFAVSDVKHIEPPAFDFKVEPCLEQAKLEPGIVRVFIFIVSCLNFSTSRKKTLVTSKRSG